MTAKDLLIRQAEVHECELLSKLGIRSKSVWGYSDELMKTFSSELTIDEKYIKACTVFVAVQRDEIVGYGSLRELDDATVELEHLFVDPSHLKQGIGSALFSHSVNEATLKSYQSLLIQCDPNAAGFYQRLGVPQKEDIPSSIPGRSIPCFRMNLRK